MPLPHDGAHDTGACSDEDDRMHPSSTRSPAETLAWVERTLGSRCARRRMAAAHRWDHVVDPPADSGQHHGRRESLRPAPMVPDPAITQYADPCRGVGGGGPHCPRAQRSAGAAPDRLDDRRRPRRSGRPDDARARAHGSDAARSRSLAAADGAHARAHSRARHRRQTVRVVARPQPAVAASRRITTRHLARGHRADRARTARRLTPASFIATTSTSTCCGRASG